MDYDIRVEILRQVRGDEVTVSVVRVTAKHYDYSHRYDFVAVEMFPKLQRIELRNPTGVYGRNPWPADRDYTHPNHEADLVALATRLAVQEWQRRQEGK